MARILKQKNIIVAVGSLIIKTTVLWYLLQPMIFSPILQWEMLAWSLKVWKNGNQSSSTYFFFKTQHIFLLKTM